MVRAWSCFPGLSGHGVLTGESSVAVSGRKLLTVFMPSDSNRCATPQDRKNECLTDYFLVSSKKNPLFKGMYTPLPGVRYGDDWS